MADRLMLLDTAAMYFRAFHGLPDSLKAPDGTSVNAVRGLLDAIARLIGEYEPSELVACWDENWRPHWRTALIPSYKAHRVRREDPDGVDVEEVPELLEPQVPVIREVLAALGITRVGAEDHEADDVIGTLATRATTPVDIVTSDRDLFQLVDDDAGVRVINTARGMNRIEVVTDAVIREKYGIGAAQYADFATLRGDTSDGLPGVAGVGEKTAAGLIADHGDLDGVITAASDPGSTMSRGARAKITAATDYLAAAAPVVRVVRDLDLGLGRGDARLRPVTGKDRERVQALGEQWNLGGSVERILTALDTR
ncbi:5'-3' exonuclease [Tersicoccus solisilvae]|uniref:5'-3' exonuclease n=1 Tax=Tersicoccus solisilvae TaxID=1882339 RepID=A0ABQ1NNB6_9MICC|nr:5'-3' exonuclease [Tersicoccus solisilvae]GGC81401.1 5'-3' exonuclease [Tersicoccus solisilvae]